VICVAAAVLVLACALYALNPFRAPDLSLTGRLFGFRTFRQASPSMEPTIRKGAYLSVRAYGILHAHPAPGDVVAFHYPSDPNVSYAKRIVAEGGDTVGVLRGRVIRNGKAVDEPYLNRQVTETADDDSMEPVQIPPNCYFVLSDNRAYGSDSREYGCVPATFIIGKVMLK
jgi:signal peptidase I